MSRIDPDFQVQKKAENLSVTSFLFAVMSSQVQIEKAKQTENRGISYCADSAQFSCSSNPALRTDVSPRYQTPDSRTIVSSSNRKYKAEKSVWNIHRRELM